MYKPNANAQCKRNAFFFFFNEKHKTLNVCVIERCKHKISYVQIYMKDNSMVFHITVYFRKRIKPT